MPRLRAQVALLPFHMGRLPDTTEATGRQFRRIAGSKLECYNVERKR